MQLASFWPPRHTVSRAGAELYQRRHTGIPWITRDAIKLLPDLLKSTDRCLEWGSGASTAWLSHRTQTVLSVEHDPAWYDRVRQQLQQAGLANGSVRLLSPEPMAQPSASPYVRVADEFDDAELDVCFLDGEHRSACALASIPKLASGGLLIIDDAHGVLDHASRSPHSRQGRGPLNGEWASFGELVKDWRLIWTSDGYSDTAIWIKP